MIGGTSLFGGVDSTALGTVLIGVLVNGLALNNVSSYTQQIVILILAVAFDRWLKTRTRG